MVITTVYKLIRPLAGKGTENKRRGVISADLSSATRAATGLSAAGALILGLAPFLSQRGLLPTDVTPEGWRERILTRAGGVLLWEWIFTLFFPR